MIEETTIDAETTPAIETASVKRSGPIKVTAGATKISSRPFRPGEILIRASGARPRRVDTTSGVQVSKPKKPLAPEMTTVPSSRPVARVEAVASRAARTSGSDLKMRSSSRSVRVDASSSAVKITGTTVRSRSHLRSKVMMGGGI